MGKKHFKPEQIILKLREAEIELSKGNTISKICRQLEISEQTYYRWRKEYGGIKVEQAKRLKLLEKENQRLKKLAADLSLEKDILRDLASGNF